MIFVKRSAKPGILEEKEAKWKSAILATTSKRAREKAQNKYRHKQIKDALVEMFRGKCAYCESSITHIDYGHIEHYKPKALPAYYDLAVEWKNLLLACGRCNGTENKGVKFPLAVEGGPLVNPTEDDPDEHLIFDYDAKARLANVLGKSPRGETTWRILGLNRPELVRHRSAFVMKLYAIATRYDHDAEARDIIDSSVEAGEEYSAFAKLLKKQLKERTKGTGRAQPI
jgi:uncharacterized protein (TIGR02646 family)